MQEGASTVRDKTAKFERKVKKWLFNRIMDIFEFNFEFILHINQH